MGALLRRCGDDEGARSAFRRAAAHGHPAWTRRALVDLGGMLAQSGELDAAAEFYERAMLLGDPSRSDGADVWSRRAAIRLEILLNRRGRTEAAQEVHHRATRHGDPEIRARFAVDRAEVLKQRGDVEGAAASFREAISLGTQIAPKAAPRQPVARSG